MPQNQHVHFVIHRFIVFAVFALFSSPEPKVSSSNMPQNQHVHFVRFIDTGCFALFSSPEPKDLSRRLVGELMGYSWSGVCPSVVHRSSYRSQCSKIFSKTACSIKAKFFLEPSWRGGTKVCSRYLGHMTKMAAMLIYGKNPSKIFFSRSAGRFSRNLFCSIGDSSP